MFGEESYAGTMCLEAGIKKESEAESLSGEGRSHVSSFDDDRLNIIGNPELVALGKADQLKRARSKSHNVEAICLRFLARRNYCETKSRGKNLPFSEESYAGKMCLEAGIKKESEAESLSGEGRSHVSSFDDDRLKITEDGYTSPSGEGTSSSAETDAVDISKNVKGTMHQHAIDSNSGDSYSDGADQHSPLQTKPSTARTEKMCQACGKVFTDSHKLTIHLKELHKNNKTATNVCTICDKQLSSSSSLHRHLLVHSGEKPHNCDICGQEFSTSGNMNRHRQTHDKRKMCRKCNVCFPCTRSLDKHMEAHEHEHSLICNVCGAMFASSNDYDFHILQYSHYGNSPLSSLSDFLNQLELRRVPHVTNEASSSQVVNFIQISPVSENVAEGYSLPVALLNPQINPNNEVNASRVLMQLSDTFPENDPLDLSARPLDLSLNKSALDLSVRPLDLSLNKRAVRHPNNTGVSQRLRNTSEQIANVPEPTPAHTSAFTPKIINFNSTIRHNAIELDMSRIASPTPFFPAQYSIPNHNAENSVISPVSSQGDTVQEKKTPKKAFECQLCGKLFSTKFNKDRHFRKQHNEFVQSSMHNSTHMSASSELPTQMQNVSESIKNRLRSVLIPKVHKYHDDSLGSESALSIVENDPNTDSSNEAKCTKTSFLNDVSKNDNENNDVASVSSVIDTANSQAINKYLKDASLRDEHTPKLHSRGDYAVESNMKKDSHEKVKRYACQICKKTFSSSNSRDRHANIHTREIDFACSECDKKFSTKSNLKRHKIKSCSKLKKYQNSFSDQLELSKNASRNLNLSGSSYNKDLGVSDFNRIHATNSLSPMLFSYENHPTDARDSNADPSPRNINFPFQNLLQKLALECMFCKNTFKNNEELTNHIKELHPLEYKSVKIIPPGDTRLSFKRRASISLERQTSISRMDNLKKKCF